MSTSEANSNGSGTSSLTDTIHTVQKVVWALFAVAVAVLVCVLVWATVDLGSPAGDVGAAVVPYLVLVGCAVFGTLVVAALAVLDP